MSSPDRLLLRSPDTALAATPHLLGFTPTDSVVILALSQDTTGAKKLLVTQRFDRPSTTGLDAGAGAGIASECARVMADAGADSVIVAVWGTEQPADRAGLPDAGFVDDLITALDDRDIATLDVLFTDGQRRWSYGCDNAACCDPTGVVIPEATKTLMAAEFAYAGQTTLATRADLETELAPLVDRDVAAALTQAYSADAQPPRPGDALTAWRTERVEALHAHATQDGPLTPADVAGTAVALGDIRVRDTYLWDLGQDGVDRQTAIRVLTQVVRSTPVAAVAPAATVLALQHYHGGDGARANIALDRAQDGDPDYSLAGLARAAISAGLPPSAWSQVMGELTRDQCLHGITAATTAAPAAASTPAPHVTPVQGIAL